MEEFRDNINSLSNTGTIENILIAIIYWLAVVVVILFVFYIAVKINNFRQYRKANKNDEKDESFLH
ncbi:MAG TPA: hypothetical protein DEO83_02315 [Lachnospiraceae bacterium]|nr:hypothetical protein [Eubacterium sp.]HBZ02634.1 hypothetical protein [Lachnospiraceae bacterium]